MVLFPVVTVPYDNESCYDNESVTPKRLEDCCGQLLHLTFIKQVLR